MFAAGAGLTLAVADFRYSVGVIYPAYLFAADAAMMVIILASPHRRAASPALPASPGPAASLPDTWQMWPGAPPVHHHDRDTHWLEPARAGAGIHGSPATSGGSPLYVLEQRKGLVTQ
jgi:hypothetical protein